MQVAMISCRKKLTVSWLAGSGLLCVLLIVQSFQHYGDKATEVWSWFLPTIMPVLSLVVAAWGVNAIGRTADSEVVDRFVFRLSLALTWAYLGAVASTILLQPFFAASIEGYIDMMHKSDLWLGPFQGLVTASIGVFFARKQHA